MKTLEQFIQEALKGNGAQNDATEVWVVVDGVQYTASIDDVLDHEETEPFEASVYLENHLDSSVWEDLYSQYCDQCTEE